MIARLCAVLLLSLVFSSTTFAQGKAYAPEDLSVLNRADQVRVLEREYADQAAGRQLPDDQLEFYLDQIESGWTFSHIKEDIAKSLGGGTGGWRPTPVPPAVILPPPVVRTFHCESRRRHGYWECRTPFRDRARLIRQTSRSACIEGRTWGSRFGLVWVTNGCAGDFAPRAVGGGVAYTVTCGSVDDQFRACAWRPQYGFPQLIEQISRSPCVEGRSWGYDRVRGLWVNRGCEARFGTRF